MQKNNDSISEKWVIIKLNTMEYRKCGNPNQENGSCLCMGATAILKSVDFRVFAINVKNDNTQAEFVSIQTRNMACIPQFDTMHPSMSLGAFFYDRNSRHFAICEGNRFLKSS